MQEPLRREVRETHRPGCEPWPHHLPALHPQRNDMVPQSLSLPTAWLKMKASLRTGWSIRTCSASTKRPPIISRRWKPRRGLGVGTKQSEVYVCQQDEGSFHVHHSWQPYLQGKKPERGNSPAKPPARFPSCVIDQNRVTSPFCLGYPQRNGEPLYG